MRLLEGRSALPETREISYADAETLAAALEGVGLCRAEAIVAYREANGRFQHADELVNVKGIGLRTVERNREYIQLGQTTPTKADKRKSG